MKRTTMAAAVLGTALLVSGTAFAADSGMNMGGAMNWYGGPVYAGAPALSVTAALVQAGGGAEDFSFPKAMVAMLGEKTVNAEVAKLDKQYGKKDVDAFLSGITYDVKDGLTRATEAGITLPAPADLHGAPLAATLVGAGTAPDGTFWAGYLFDHALSHKLHNQVMIDVNTHLGTEDDTNTHRILNQAMYDVAQALGKQNVKLAAFH